jgi:alpha-tubulin suppressor-like RCC1 family protein
MSLGARAAALLLPLFACYGPEAEAPHPTIPDDGALLRLDKDSMVVEFTALDRLVASRTDSAGQPKPARLHWFSRNETIVVVDSGGILAAVGIGRTWVVVSDFVHEDSARVTVSASYSSVFAGTDATCALTSLGIPLCWGWNGALSLGNGSDSDADAVLPTPVSGRPHFDAITMGAGTACGVASGIARCWGYNGVGQLGDGTVLPRSAPVLVADTALYRRVVLGAGATSCAFDVTGRVLCWGWNGYGQLLNGTVANSRRPVALNAGVTLTAIATGGGHMCGLDSVGGAWCWGRNDRGQLGNGTTDASTVPVQVAGTPPFVQITAGVEHTCARTPPGQVWCWGDNRHGQLATAASAGFTATAALAADGATFESVTTSAYHSCALGAGVAWCWGENEYGQLGRGSAGGTAIAQVAGGLHWTSISAGVNHTCGMADGVAYCWGENIHGDLGDGSLFDSGVPKRVAFQP